MDWPTYDCPDCDYTGTKFTFDPLGDVEEKNCPECGTNMRGHEIPEQ